MILKLGKMEDKSISFAPLLITLLPSPRRLGAPSTRLKTFL